MRAYDQLPRILRDALKSCPIDASAVMCLQEFRMSRNAPVLANEITSHFIKTLNNARQLQGLPRIKSLKSRLVYKTVFIAYFLVPSVFVVEYLPAVLLHFA